MYLLYNTGIYIYSPCVTSHSFKKDLEGDLALIWQLQGNKQKSHTQGSK